MPDSAWVCCIAVSSSRSAMYWIFSSMVRTTFSPGIGLLLDAAEPFPAGVHRDQHAAGLAAQLVVILALDPAQAFVVHAHVAEDLRCQFAFGIKALGFLLEIDAAQIQGPDAVRGFRVRLARDPAEGTGSFAFGQQFARIGLGDARDQGDGSGQVGNFGRHREHGIHRDRHRQFAAGTVVDDAALGRNFVVRCC